MSSSGGRRSSWVRNWTVWTYFRDYFPIRVGALVKLLMCRRWIDPTQKKPKGTVDLWSMAPIMRWTMKASTASPFPASTEKHLVYSKIHPIHRSPAMQRFDIVDKLIRRYQLAAPCCSLSRGGLSRSEILDFVPSDRPRSSAKLVWPSDIPPSIFYMRGQCW